MAGKRNSRDITASTEGRKRASKSTADHNAEQYSSLPELVLYLIFIRLGRNITDLLTFAGVCKGWRVVAKTSKSYLASLPPMLMLRRNSLSADIGFYGLPDKKFLFKKKLRISTKPCIGFSCGSLIMTGPSTLQPWLVNPITGARTRLPKASATIASAILSSPPTTQDWLVLAWKQHVVDNLMIYRAGDVEWRVQGGFSGRVLNAMLYKDKFCVLRRCSVDDASLGHKLMIMDLVLQPELKLVETECFPLPSELQEQLDLVVLAQLNGELLLVHIPFFYYWLRFKCIMVYRLDFEEKKWERVENIGDHAFFLSYNGCSVMQGPTAWGLERNSIYLVKGDCEALYVYSMEDARTELQARFSPYNCRKHITSCLCWCYEWISPSSII